MRLPFVVGSLTVALAGAAAAQSVRLSVSVPELETRAHQDSTDPAAYYNLAVGYISQRHYDQADTALNRAVALDPQFALAYFALGLVQDRNDRFWRNLRRTGDTAVTSEERRRAAFERKAFLIDPFLDIRLLGSVVQRGYVSLGVSRAVEDLATGDYPAAYEHLTSVVHYIGGSAGLDSVAPTIIWLHALASAHTDHLPDAITDAEALLRQSLREEHDDSTHTAPLHTNEYRYMLAALHQRAGHEAEAIRLYEEVATLDLGNYMAHVQLARMFEARRDWDHAIAERRAATEVNPEDHTLMFDLGATLARAGRWSEAEDALQRASTMQPLYSRTFHALGVVEQQLNKPDDARAALTRFLAIAPSRYTAQVNDARQRLAQLQ